MQELAKRMIACKLRRFIFWHRTEMFSHFKGRKISGSSRQAVSEICWMTFSEIRIDVYAVYQVDAELNLDPTKNTSTTSRAVILPKSCVLREIDNLVWNLQSHHYSQNVSQVTKNNRHSFFANFWHFSTDSPRFTLVAYLFIIFQANIFYTRPAVGLKLYPPSSTPYRPYFGSTFSSASIFMTIFTTKSRTTKRKKVIL